MQENISLPEFDYFWEYVRYWAEQDPDFPTLRYQNQIITAAEFEHKSLQLAKHMIKAGINKGDRIVTVIPCHPEYMIIFTACSMIGAIIVPLDVRYRFQDFLSQLPILEPKWIISLVETTKDSETIKFDEILNQIKNTETNLGMTELYFLDESKYGKNYGELFSQSIDRHEIYETLPQQTSNDNTLIIWTGGTTGLPKAALLSHKNVVRMCYLEDQFIRKIIQSQGVNGRTKLLANLPVSHVGGTVEIIGVGVVGGHEIIFHDRWSASATLKTIHDERISFYLGAPTMYRLMMKSENFEEYDLSHLKLAMISGEIVNSEYMGLMRKYFSETIINGYGSTEIGPEVTFTEGLSDYEKITVGYVGKPLSGVNIIIQDLHGKTLGTNQIGEVLVKGDLVCNGYFRNEEATKNAFSSDGYFHSGDLGKFDSNGGLWLTGRIKEVIRVGTYTVLPQEIEEVVFNKFELEMAAAFSAPNELLGEVVWLAITPKNNKTYTEEEIVSVCKTQLADYKVPKKVIFYTIDPSNPPMTRIGKIDRRRIRSEILSH